MLAVSSDHEYAELTSVPANWFYPLVLVLFACDSYSIGWYHFGIGSANYSTEHSGKAYILSAKTDVGVNTSLFCYVLDWINHLLLRRYEYQCSYCWSCYCNLPDKDFPRIGEESSQHKVLNLEAHAKGSILVGGNSN